LHSKLNSAWDSHLSQRLDRHRYCNLRRLTSSRRAWRAARPGRW